jgi:DedD protein
LDYTDRVDNQVKERLTGALILVAALVVIVPEIFSGPRHKSGETAAPDAQPANAGPPLRSYTMELGAGKTAGDQSALTPESQPAARAAAAPASTATEVSPAPLPHPVPATPAPKAAPAAEAQPQPDVPAQQSSKPVATVVPKPATAAKGAEWWVQIGVFSQRDNAQRLTNELQAKGFATQLAAVSVKGKELFRVRAGPVADRVAAQALQNRLATSGHRGSLVAP